MPPPPIGYNILDRLKESIDYSATHSGADRTVDTERKEIERIRWSQHIEVTVATYLHHEGACGNVAHEYNTLCYDIHHILCGLNAKENPDLKSRLFAYQKKVIQLEQSPGMPENYTQQVEMALTRILEVIDSGIQEDSHSPIKVTNIETPPGSAPGSAEGTPVKPPQPSSRLPTGDSPPGDGGEPGYYNVPNKRRSPRRLFLNDGATAHQIKRTTAPAPASGPWFKDSSRQQQTQAANLDTLTATCLSS